jgi:hypothetical protein
MPPDCTASASTGQISYEIFFNGNYTVDPTDKELKRYLREEVHEPAHT